jgi:hypothetical protein
MEQVDWDCGCHGSFPWVSSLPTAEAVILSLFASFERERLDSIFLRNDQLAQRIVARRARLAS